MKQYMPYLFLSIFFIALSQFMFGIEYANTNEFVGIVSILLSGIVMGISAGFAIRALLPETREEKEQTPLTNTKTKRKIARDNRLAEMLELMDDEERQIFMQALKDRYLSQKSNNLIDGELPFDDDSYFEDKDDYYRRQ